VTTTKENTIMQKASSSPVTVGGVSPTLVGPDKDMKEIYLLSGLILFLAVVVAAFWYYSQSDEPFHTGRPSDTVTNAQVATTLHAQSGASPSVSAPALHIEAIPVATRSSDVLHDDVYFEIGRKGLTDDGRAALQKHAEFLKNEEDWGILVQGYTDQQGSMSYNKTLGFKRAETVKQQLMALGVPETAIRIVSLGEEGALCIDTSDTCRRMNRRVHLEIRKVGREHMTIPAAATPPAMEDAISSPIISGSQPDSSEMTGDGQLREATTALPEALPDPSLDAPVPQNGPQ
jgi:peptidoglycan-associated lipoprotein